MESWKREGAVCFQQLSDVKRSPDAIAAMCWCPTMDLVAVTTVDNSLVLYRLSWQKVWTISAEDDTIAATQWRPDGKSEYTADKEPHSL